MARLREPFHISLHLAPGVDEDRERRNDMRNLLLTNTSLRTLLLAGLAGLPLTLALGHEAHPSELALIRSPDQRFQRARPSIGCRTTGTTPGAPRRRARNRTLPPLPTEETFPRTLNRSV